jgi:hypothetical protein
MGDNRQATRAPGPAPDAKKKDGANDGGGDGAVPEGAAADPGGALMALGTAHAATLLGMLQSSGGNAEVDELTSLDAGKQVAAQAKADKENFDTMKDGEKLQKFGGKGEGSGKAPPPDGTPPDGAAQPAAVQSFHATRAAQLQQLSGQHMSVGGQLSGASGAEGLAPAMAGFLAQGGAQSLAQGTTLSQLAAAYIQTSAQLGKSEFIGAAMPGSEVQAGYQARAEGIQAQVSALDAMATEYAAALAAEQANITACQEQIAAVQQQIAEAQAAKSEQKGGAAPAEPSGRLGAEAKAEAPAPAATRPGADAKADVKPAAAPAKAPQGASAKSAAPAPSGRSPAAAPAPAPVKEVAAAAKEAPAAAAPPGGDGADPVAGLTAQVQTLLQRKQAIEAAIRSNQGLVSTMQAYRDQMNQLLAAYQTVLGITPPAA